MINKSMTNRLSEKGKLPIERMGRCQKKRFLGLCPKLWGGGGSKVLNFLVKTHIQFICTANIQKCPEKYIT